MWDTMIQVRLDAGDLPFPNSDICPVSPYGTMEPWKYGNPVELNEFAEQHLRDYEELDEVGQIAHAWAREIALAARKVIGA